MAEYSYVKVHFLFLQIYLSTSKMYSDKDKYKSYLSKLPRVNIVLLEKKKAKTSFVVQM